MDEVAVFIMLELLAEYRSAAGGHIPCEVDAVEVARHGRVLDVGGFGHCQWLARVPATAVMVFAPIVGAVPRRDTGLELIHTIADHNQKIADENIRLALLPGINILGRHRIALG